MMFAPYAGWIQDLRIIRAAFVSASLCQSPPAQLELDVTPLVRPGQTNAIAIRVDTSLSAAQAAEGIQSRVFLYTTP